MDTMVPKAFKRLYILRLLRRYGVPPADLRLIYFSLVRSTLEYACAAWHTCLPIYLSRKVEMVQKRALRIIHPEMHYEDALLALQCSRLDDRRSSLCLKTLKKIEEPASRLHHLLPVSRGSSRDLRNSNRFSPKCTTNRYKMSFIPAICYSQP